ncbi:DUF89 family protein, partial [Myxococcota bacterium]|nr:DUF89 family protein [Myxococcota bacterium]
MKTYLECFSCFMNSAVRTAKTFSNDREFQEKVSREILGFLSLIDLSRTPPEMGAFIEHHIFSSLALDDPFGPLRSQYNKLMLNLLPRFRQEVTAASSPFEAALRLAIGGNIIDFGNEYTMTEELVHETLTSSMTATFHLGTPGALDALIKRAGTILYIGDNCGEIVLDRLFIETVGPKKFTFAVRGAPILNDVVREDAREAGLDTLVPVIDTGQAIPGVVLSSASEAFLQEWEAS